MPHPLSHLLSHPLSHPLPIRCPSVAKYKLMVRYAALRSEGSTLRDDYGITELLKKQIQGRRVR